MNEPKGESALRSLREQRADCLRLLAHDLNNPLTAIRILAEMLRDDIADDELRRDMIDVLEAADLASAIMDGMSSLVRLEGEEEEFTWFPIDLVQVLKQAADRPALRRHVRFELPREIQMGGDRRALQRAFTDILVNARRLVERQMPVTLYAEDRPKMVRVVVNHPGLGVPPELRGRLLELFGAVELRRKRIPVAAVGLTYARYVVDKHGGTLALADGADSGMDVVVTLPR